MRASTSRYPDLYFVGEGWGMTREEIVRATGDRNKELSSAFIFDFLLLDITDGWRKLPWSLKKLKAFNRENSFADYPHVWPVVFLEDGDRRVLCQDSVPSPRISGSVRKAFLPPCCFPCVVRRSSTRVRKSV